MVGKWAYVPALALLGRCQSFHVPGPPSLTGGGFLSQAAAVRRVSADRPVTATTTISRSSFSRGQQAVRRLQVLASSGGEIETNNHSSTSDGEGSSTPYHPTRLWWTKSRAEEDATINLVANGGFIVAVVIFALVTLFTVDVDVSRGWTTSEFILRVPIDNWQAYMEVLRGNPVLVKACTSGIVYALGDWTAQTSEGIALADIKRERVLRSSMAGLLLHGPLSHVWYGVCEGLFDALGWNENWWVTIPKIVTDQLFWGPAWNAVYILFLGVLKRDSIVAIWEAITSTALPLVLAGVRLWPLAHVITYGLVPTENRLLWVDFVEIIWVTILSRQAAEQARSAGQDAEVGGGVEGTESVPSGVHAVEAREGKAEPGLVAAAGATIGTLGKKTPESVDTVTLANGNGSEMRATSEMVER